MKFCTQRVFMFLLIVVMGVTMCDLQVYCQSPLAPETPTTQISDTQYDHSDEEDEENWGQFLLSFLKPSWTWGLYLTRFGDIKTLINNFYKARRRLESRQNILPRVRRRLEAKLKRAEDEVRSWISRMRESKQLRTGLYEELVRIAPSSDRENLRAALQKFKGEGSTEDFDVWLRSDQGRQFLENDGASWNTKYQLSVLAQESNLAGLLQKNDHVNDFLTAKSEKMETDTRSLGEFTAGERDRPFHLEYTSPQGHTTTVSYDGVNSRVEKNCNKILDQVGDEEKLLAHKRKNYHWDRSNYAAAWGEAKVLLGVTAVILGAEGTMKYFQSKTEKQRKQLSKDPHKEERQENYERSSDWEIDRRADELEPFNQLIARVLLDHRDELKNVIDASGASQAKKDAILGKLMDPEMVHSAAFGAFKEASEQEWGSMPLKEKFKRLRETDPKKLEVEIGNSFLSKFWDEFGRRLLGDEDHRVLLPDPEATADDFAAKLRTQLRDAILPQLVDVIPANGNKTEKEE